MKLATSPVVSALKDTPSGTFSAPDLDEIDIKSISEVNISMLNDLDQLIEEREIELNRPKINIEEELKNAKKQATPASEKLFPTQTCLGKA